MWKVCYIYLAFPLNISLLNFMAGRILYGLAKGKQLKDNEVFPSEEQLESIKNGELKKLLKYVFERSNKKMKHSLEDVS